MIQMSHQNQNLHPYYTQAHSKILNNNSNNKNNSNNNNNTASTTITTTTTTITTINNSTSEIIMNSKIPKILDSNGSVEPITNSNLNNNSKNPFNNTQNINPNILPNNNNFNDRKGQYSIPNQINPTNPNSYPVYSTHQRLQPNIQNYSNYPNNMVGNKNNNVHSMNHFPNTNNQSNNTLEFNLKSNPKKNAKNSLNRIVPNGDRIIPNAHVHHPHPNIPRSNNINYYNTIHNNNMNNNNNIPHGQVNHNQTSNNYKLNTTTNSNKTHHNNIHNRLPLNNSKTFLNNNNTSNTNINIGNNNKSTKYTNNTSFHTVPSIKLSENNLPIQQKPHIKNQKNNVHVKPLLNTPKKINSPTITITDESKISHMSRSPKFNTNQEKDKDISKSNTDDNTPKINSNELVSKSQMKVCAKCNLPIDSKNKDKSRGSVLKALGNYYHEHCFSCHDCSTWLKKKYFPYKDPMTDKTILLCQYHYFYRHNLLCYVCDKPLRGLYYTAFDRRYDEEHFSCTICKKPCGIKKCFIYDDKLYCKYHFLKYFSKRCKGCDFPISDQYIEFPKGKDIHCWHPECYGIQKYWHVTLSAENLSIPAFKYGKFDSKTLEHSNTALSDEENTDLDANTTFDPRKMKSTQQQVVKRSASQTAAQLEQSRDEMQKNIKLFTSILSKTWSVMYRFEEETASTITDMFQYLTIIDQIKGIEATALFVLKIECLFKALEPFDAFNGTLKKIKTNEELKLEESNNYSSVDNVHYRCSKLPKKISTKIMVYLQLLRKLNIDFDKNKMELTGFMSVITSVAHFLKLLTRYGIFGALLKNKSIGSNTPLLLFLREVEKNEIYKSNPFNYIKVSIKSTDGCSKCTEYIQEECIQYGENRWHLHCFQCHSCGSVIDKSDLGEATFNNKLKKVLCSKCSINDPESLPGFKYVSNLGQLVYLLKIALVKSKTVMELQMKNRVNSTYPNQMREAISMHQTYIRTLNDIKRLKSQRESIPMAHDKQQARKSVVLETTETNIVQEDSNLTEQKLIIETDAMLQPPSANENVFGNSKSLTLDDISRIVAAEQARELRPNAFAHFKKLKDDNDDDGEPAQRRSGIYYAEKNEADMNLLRLISIALLKQDLKSSFNEVDINEYIGTCSNHNEKPAHSGNFWSKMRVAMNIESKKPEPKKMFGSPLNVVCSKWGIDSDLGIGPSKIRIPVIIHELISCMRQKDMSVEGVFRKNGNIRKLREITELIDSYPDDIPDLSTSNAIQLSALLKKFLRDLPDPIMTKILYNIWISIAKLEDSAEKQRLLALAYTILPTYNRNVLEVIFSFLFWTASFSHFENKMGSKMDIHNLSTVMAPNILYFSNERNISGTTLTNESSHPSSTNTSSNLTNGKIREPDQRFAEAGGENYFLGIEIIDSLITHHEDMSIIPKFLTTLLEEVKLKKIETFEDIEEFIKTKIMNTAINYNEFEIKNQLKMVNSGSIVTQNKMENNN
ncbi:hypothetical protein TBLA_0G00120 [Henningerozyma blattae CBS 6284]|uniref:RhoGAP-domain-containing protein n=1 Tax=Henningerozyma blattae (strain ATCC 34711 / CBS 6284 / DSM 70876 / NBRC 10599 / NRRL Y-10934 / UCD 77-7) TaxID=1071380 RepID=I2H6G1_HENB6|nr:hypothetical protein TBLA_0G00120 [Tetrapisispora blattae CBS 6284]CCH61963.1 hypothetical protein TBLA_0G00120 [Tetrapisispora blattae CBS 6284]